MSHLPLGRAVRQPPATRIRRCWPWRLVVEAALPAIGLALAGALTAVGLAPVGVLAAGLAAEPPATVLTATEPPAQASTDFTVSAEPPASFTEVGPTNSAFTQVGTAFTYDYQTERADAPPLSQWAGSNYHTFVSDGATLGYTRTTLVASGTQGTVTHELLGAPARPTPVDLVVVIDPALRVAAVRSALTAAWALLAQGDSQLAIVLAGQPDASEAAPPRFTATPPLATLSWPQQVVSQPAALAQSLQAAAALFAAPDRGARLEATRVIVRLLAPTILPASAPPEALPTLGATKVITLIVAPATSSQAGNGTAATGVAPSVVSEPALTTALVRATGALVSPIIAAPFSASPHPRTTAPRNVTLQWLRLDPARRTLTPVAGAPPYAEVPTITQGDDGLHVTGITLGPTDGLRISYSQSVTPTAEDGLPAPISQASQLDLDGQHHLFFPSPAFATTASTATVNPMRELSATGKWQVDRAFTVTLQRLIGDDWVTFQAQTLDGTTTNTARFTAVPRYANLALQSYRLQASAADANIVTPAEWTSAPFTLTRDVVTEPLPAQPRLAEYALALRFPDGTRVTANTVLLTRQNDPFTLTLTGMADPSFKGLPYGAYTVTVSGVDGFEVETFALSITPIDQALQVTSPWNASQPLVLRLKPFTLALTLPASAGATWRLAGPQTADMAITASNSGEHTGLTPGDYTLTELTPPPGMPKFQGHWSFTLTPMGQVTQPVYHGRDASLAAAKITATPGRGDATNQLKFVLTTRPRPNTQATLLPTTGRPTLAILLGTGLLALLIALARSLRKERHA